MKKPNTVKPLKEIKTQLISAGYKDFELMILSGLTFALGQLEGIHECVYALANNPPAKGNFIDLDGRCSVNAESVESVIKSEVAGQHFINIACKHTQLFELGPMSLKTRDIQYDLIMCQLMGVEKRVSEYGKG